MQVLERKILLEDSVDRTANSPTWGVMTATTFYIKINLTQNIDDMGLLTNIEYIPKDDISISQPDYTVLINKLSSSGITFPFMNGVKPNDTTNISKTDNVTLRLPNKKQSDYYVYGNSIISGLTDSKIDDIRSYDRNNIYRVGFDTHTETYVNYKNETINGVDRIFSMGEPRIYVFDTPNNNDLGTVNQKHGLRYLEYTGQTRTVTIDNINSTINLTSVNYIGEGINETNTSLSAMTKEEYLFGITTEPQVESDVFIDRGQVSVMDMHLRLSEIKNLDELARYGNGFYNLNKQ